MESISIDCRLLLQSRMLRLNDMRPLFPCFEDSIERRLGCSAELGEAAGKRRFPNCILWSDRS